MKKTVGIIALMAIIMLSSCLKGDNQSVFNGMVGTFEAVQLSGATEPQLMVRLDVDGSLIKLPVGTTDAKAGDRILAGFKIDYDNQSAEATKNGYFDVTNVVVEKIETLFSTDPESTEVLPSDPIMQLTTGYMIKTIGAPQRYLFTLSGYYNAASNSAHKFQLLRKPFETGADNDTLRYELRHDKMGDVENQLNRRMMYSFDCSYEMTSLASSEKTLVIELVYWNKQGVKIKEYLKYIYPKF